MRGDLTRGGDDAEEEDTLGCGLCSPELFSVACDWRLTDRDCDICCAKCSGMAGLGGMSLNVVLEAMELRITDVAMSRTLGRLLRVDSVDCSVLDRGVPLDEGGREMLDFELCKPEADFQDLRIDFLTPLLLSTIEPDIDGGRWDGGCGGALVGAGPSSCGGGGGGERPMGMIGYGESWLKYICL